MPRDYNTAVSVQLLISFLLGVPSTCNVNAKSPLVIPELDVEQGLDIGDGLALDVVYRPNSVTVDTVAASPPAR
ncbi:MAG: hypothetical protein AB8G17_17005 [Gammaproteobacteria bacterium]